MRLAGIDLNLLTSLDALLDEHNVTRAAKRLGVSQPAVSHSLRRLRELLGDPLLVRAPGGIGLVATPRAIELRPAVRAALDAAEAVLQAAPRFDPARAERRFVLAMADQAAYQLLPPVVATIAAGAPGITLDLRPPAGDLNVPLLDGEVDLAIGVFDDAPTGLRTEALWHDTMACVTRRGGPGARTPLDLDHYLARPHLLVAPRGRPGGFVDDLLAHDGLRRRIVVIVPHFLVAPAIIAGSDLIWTAPAGLARTLATHYPLAIRTPPLAIPGFTLALRWHVRLDRDPGLAWLREQLRAAAP
ncbi:MAG TPA: LysR family transcriptional regulator [Kofleriaceae bacterium]|nr:LysR family transcriptional regulator [Kofleriaceae bacterium]